MTPRLPTCKPVEVERVLFRIGFRISRQRGSHRTYYRARDQRHATIIWHPGDLKRGSLRRTLEQAGLSEEQFLALRRGKKAA